MLRLNGGTQHGIGQYGTRPNAPIPGQNARQRPGEANDTTRPGGRNIGRMSGDSSDRTRAGHEGRQRDNQRFLATERNYVARAPVFGQSSGGGMSAGQLQASDESRRNLRRSGQPPTANNAAPGSGTQPGASPSTEAQPTEEVPGPESPRSGSNEPGLRITLEGDEERAELGATVHHEEGPVEVNGRGTIDTEGQGELEGDVTYRPREDVQVSGRGRVDTDGNGEAELSGTYSPNEEVQITGRGTIDQDGDMTGGLDVVYSPNDDIDVNINAQVDENGDSSVTMGFDINF